MSSLGRELLDQFDRTMGVIGMMEGDKSREYPIDCRLNLRVSTAFWAVTMERLVYVPAAVRYQHSVYAGIRTWVFFWGNCLKPTWKPLMRPLSLSLAADTPVGPSFIRIGNCARAFLNKKVSAISVRGEVIPLETDVHSYDEVGINLSERPNICVHEALRAMPPVYRRRFFLSENEFAARFRREIIPPIVLSIDEWRNPLVDERPSRCESIRMLAEVVSSGNVAMYDPWCLFSVLPHPLEAA